MLAIVSFASLASAAGSSLYAHGAGSCARVPGPYSFELESCPRNPGFKPVMPDPFQSPMKGCVSDNGRAIMIEPDQTVTCISMTSTGHELVPNCMQLPNRPWMISCAPNNFGVFINQQERTNDGVIYPGRICASDDNIPEIIQGYIRDILTYISNGFQQIYVVENHHQDVSMALRSNLATYSSEESKFIIFQEAAFESDRKELFQGLSPDRNSSIDKLKSLVGLESRIYDYVRDPDRYKKQSILADMNNLQRISKKFDKKQRQSQTTGKAIRVPEEQRSGFNDALGILIGNIESDQADTIIESYNIAVDKLDRLREENWKSVAKKKRQEVQVRYPGEKVVEIWIIGSVHAERIINAG